ncbi:AI-2E family transporter [Ornithinibacillus halotolerans]|uniref:AI-2E family transporter n=1 Tax=Ornithinibacillus halotolerans TaxID=1274357 RepID=A0A916RNB7_9BACI|nr:AI-2E family transporter [Ornithinibacillus halotolerans]GGA63678.1 AI-2E family transporter [Ornithinibacillus halotolerans]
MVALILSFLLIYLVYKTRFIFDPAFKYIGAIAFPLIAAGLLYYLTRPVMKFLLKYKVPKLLGILIIFVLIILVGFVFTMFIIPIARDQFERFVANIPTMVKAAQDVIDYIQTNESIQRIIPEEVDETIDNIMANLQSYIEGFMTFLIGFISQIVGFIFSLVLVPFFLFFMLKDGEKFMPFVTQIFEPKKASNLRNLLQKIDHTLSAYIQGQLLVSLSIGVMLFIGYLIIDLNYALSLALFGMVMCVVPFIGPFIAVVPAAIVGVFEDPMNVVWIAIIMIIAQQIEGNFISPNIMGHVLRIHPLTIITIILAAGSIAGFIGILFAVPFYAVVKAIIVHFWETYQDTRKNKEDALI